MKTPDTPLGRYLRHIARANRIILKQIVNENQKQNNNDKQ